MASKKVSAKPRSSGGSQNYNDKVSKTKATNRASADRGQAKLNSSKQANDVKRTTAGKGAINLTMAQFKAGKDARSRAAKYGTPVGSTLVNNVVKKRNRSGSPIDDVVSSTTQVKVPGGMLSVKEEKFQRFAGFDGKPKTTVSGVTNRKSQSGDLGSQRAAQRAKKKK
jgi:hypothetical protein